MRETKLDVAQELDLALRLAAKELPKRSSREVAESFYDSESALVAHFQRDWAIEWIAASVRQKRATMRHEDSRQFCLFGFEPPKEIIVRGGKRIAFADATIHRLEQYRAVLWKKSRSRKSLEIERIDKVISMMKEFTGRRFGMKVHDLIDAPVNLSDSQPDLSTRASLNKQD